jgi:phosphoribosyl 1,2-cyclic phosphodiesterase
MAIRKSQIKNPPLLICIKSALQRLLATRMSLELCILASGSAGNCTILRSGRGVVLIDAGIGPRTAAKRMSGTGVLPADVRAICLTHLDRDHFSPTWFDTIERNGIRLFCHESRRGDLAARLQEAGCEAPLHTFNGHSFEPVDGVEFRAVSLEHDAEGSHGFLIESDGVRVGYATDLGRVPASLLEAFCGVDLLALESNYDHDMELSSERPWFLKHRIMGGRGHLSNAQAFEAICAILDRCQRRRRRLPQHIVLLHRSRQCNCPKLMRTLFESDPRVGSRLTVAEQYVRTEWLALRPRAPMSGEQLVLPL